MIGFTPPTSPAQSQCISCVCARIHDQSSNNPYRPNNCTPGTNHPSSRDFLVAPPHAIICCASQPSAFHAIKRNHTSSCDFFRAPLDITQSYAAPPNPLLSMLLSSITLHPATLFSSAWSFDTITNHSSQPIPHTILKYKCCNTIDK